MQEAKPINILMVETDLEFSKTITNSLSEIDTFPFSIDCVSSLEEAFYLLKTKKFDLILLDLFLKESHGLLTLKKIKTQEPNIPVIILTNNENLELAINAVRYGAQDYLIKRQVTGHFLSLAIRYAVERKKTEQFQKEQLHFLQSVMDNIPSPLYIKDITLLYGACNAAFERLIGKSKKDLIGHSVFDIFDRKISDLMRSKELKLLAGSPTQIYEISLPDSSGNILDMVFHETAHERQDGTLAGLIGIGVDISNLKNAEKSLQEAKNALETKVQERTKELTETNILLRKQIEKRKQFEKLLNRERKIFTNGPVIVFRFRVTKKIPVEYVSQNIRHLGYSPENFINGTYKYTDIIHPDYREKVVSEILKHSKSGEENFEQSFVILRKDGSSVPVCSYVVISRGIGERVMYFDGYILDVTDWKNKN